MVNIWIVAAVRIWYLVLNSFRSVWIYSVDTFYVLWNEWAACTIDDQRLIAVNDTRKKKINENIRCNGDCSVSIKAIWFWSAAINWMAMNWPKWIIDFLTYMNCNSWNYNINLKQFSYLWILVWFGLAIENWLQKRTFVVIYEPIKISYLYGIR